MATSLLSHNSPVPAGLDAGAVKGKAESYLSYFGKDKESLARRIQEHAKVTDTFYDLVTDFYQYGWGDAFHFAPRAAGETFFEAVKRHEYFLALTLGLKPGMTCLDVGCGVGGPLVEIGRFSGANITGVNNNAYQIKKANAKIQGAKLENTCNIVNSDFMHMPFENNSIDRAYAIEATCHASDRTGCYAEIARCLKPGGLFSAYEWVSTEEMNTSDKSHRAILEGIEIGNALPPIISKQDVLKSLEDAGFEVVSSKDFGTDNRFPVPWHEPLAGRFSMSGMRHTKVGRWCTHTAVSWLEWLKLIPKGTTDIHNFLLMTADALVQGGDKGIFTPCFWFVARKK